MPSTASGTAPLAVDGNVPQPDPRYVEGSAHPQVKAGSATWPLDMIAGISPDGRMLRIAVVNATFAPQRFAVDLHGLRTRGAGAQWVLTGATLEAANKVGQPAGVTIADKKVPALGRQLTVPAISTSVFEFPIAR